MIQITADKLIKGMGAVSAAAYLWEDAINETLRLFEIGANKTRAASFLAQIAHESGSLEHAREIWGPTRAQKRYEGRRDLGNTQPGDGYRYRGRGLIQITGRANARKVTKHLQPLVKNCPDFEERPELLELPRWGALSAGAFWDWNDLNPLGDKGATVKITRIINGGYNGLASRRKLYQRLLRVL